MNEYLVSVIVPNYKHAAFLKQRLDSVFSQSYASFEVILLDDKSPDDSVAIMREYKDRPQTAALVVNESNTGSPFAQWRKGVSMAKGEYIWIAESDDYCEPTLLEELVRCIERESNLSMVYCQSQDVDLEGRFLENRLGYTAVFDPNIWENDFVCEGSDFIRKYLQNKNVVPNASACLVRKDLISRALSEFELISNFKVCGDWVLWLAICSSSSARIGFSAKTLNYFRRSPESTRAKWNIPFAKKTIEEELIIRSRLSVRFGLEGRVQARYIKKLTRQYNGLVSLREGVKGYAILSEILNKSSFSLYLELIKHKLKGSPRN